MRVDSLFYRLAYRSGTPRWDSTEPRPELTELAKGRVPGRALDLGCGTGSDVLYLASLGWDATTRPGGDLYLAGVTNPPATWRLLGARGLSARDLRRRFGPDFELADQQTAGQIGRAGTFVFYHLVRRRPGTADAAGDITAASASTGPGSVRPAQRLRASWRARAQCHLRNVPARWAGVSPSQGHGRNEILVYSFRREG